MAEATLRQPADALLKYYNSICRVRAKAIDKNLKLIEKCLKLNDQNEEDLREYMKWYCLYKNDQDLKQDFEECMSEYKDYYNLAFGSREMLESHTEDTIPGEEKEETEQQEPDIEMVVYESNEVETDEPNDANGKPVKKPEKSTDSEGEKGKSTGRKNRRKKAAANENETEVKEINDDREEKSEEDKMSAAANMQQMSTGGNADPLGMLGASMAGLFQSIISEAMNSQYESMLSETKKEIMSFVEEKYGERVKVVKYEFDDERLHPLEDEVVHEKLQEVLNFVAAKEPVYLVGPTGCGKNHLCKQVAKILDLPFYFCNAVTQEYKLVGFTDANGIYQETQFYKAFKDGGIFMLDEIDASLPDALIILNAAISNGYFDFPAPIGFVEAHPDFRIIAAGNTWGCGADIQYVGRNQLDMASLDRFGVVNIDYSYSVEAALCPDPELQGFLRDYRNAVYRNGLMTTVSYRVFRRMYLLEDRFDSLSECLDSCLCKGLCKDDLMMIHKQMKSESRYKAALKELADARRD